MPSPWVGSPTSPVCRTPGARGEYCLSPTAWRFASGHRSLPFSAAAPQEHHWSCLLEPRGGVDGSLLLTLSIAHCAPQDDSASLDHPLGETNHVIRRGCMHGIAHCHSGLGLKLMDSQGTIVRTYWTPKGIWQSTALMLIPKHPIAHSLTLYQP